MRIGASFPDSTAHPRYCDVRGTYFWRANLCYRSWSWPVRESSSGWWCRPRWASSHRCYRSPCLRVWSCGNGVCLWWRKQRYRPADGVKGQWSATTPIIIMLKPTVMTLTVTWHLNGLSDECTCFTWQLKWSGLDLKKRKTITRLIFRKPNVWPLFTCKNRSVCSDVLCLLW